MPEMVVLYADEPPRVERGTDDDGMDKGIWEFETETEYIFCPAERLIAYKEVELLDG